MELATILNSLGWACRKGGVKCDSRQQLAALRTAQKLSGRRMNTTQARAWAQREWDKSFTLEEPLAEE